MDIVDKVFEGLSLSDQAEKARKITAHQRKKEFKKRQTLRFAGLGLVGVVILGAVITGVVTHLPKNSAADSDIKVDFTTEKTIEPTTEVIDETPAEEPSETNETAAEALPEKTEVKKAPVVKKTSSGTTKKTTVVTSNKSWIDSNAEKVDQGSTGGNGCRVISGNTLYCKDAPSQTTPSAPTENTGENQGNQGGVEQKDEGASGDTGTGTDTGGSN